MRATGTHVDAVLTNMSVAYPQAGNFVSDVLFPIVPVKKSTDKYFLYTKENLRTEDDERANGALANQAGFSLLGTDAINVIEYALREVVTQTDREDADKPIDPDEDNTWVLTEKILLGKEVRAATLAAATANYETGYSTTLVTTDQWSDYDNSDPIGDIETGREKVESGGVPTPNVVVVGITGWNKLKHHPSILERIKFSQIGVVTADLVAPIVDVDRVVVARATRNTAIQGAADSLSHVWSDDVVIAWVTPSPGKRRATYGYSFQTKKGRRRVFRYMAEGRGEGAQWIEVIENYDHKLVSVDNLSDKDSIAGYLIKDTVA